MTFKEYWKSLTPESKASLASEAGSSVNYLSQVANGHRGIGLRMLTRLTRARPEITAAMLRPDLFGMAS